MCINETTKVYGVRAHPAHGETCARHLPISSLARPHFPLPENGLNKNYINYSGAPAQPIIHSRLASSFKFKKGSEEAAARNGEAAAAAAEQLPRHLLLPSEETIAGKDVNLS